MAPVRTTGLLGLLLLAHGVLGTPRPTPTEGYVAARADASAEAPDVTEVTDCHTHGESLYVFSLLHTPRLFDVHRCLPPSTADFVC